MTKRTNYRLQQKTTNEEYGWYLNEDSFKIFMCVEGSGKINTKDYSLSISVGETALIPSKIKNLSLENNNEEMKLLEVYIK